jgi:hypothetical protein
MDGCLAFWCYSSYLYIHTMACLFEVLHSVIVAPGAVIVFATASEMSASHAEPQVCFELALLAMSKSFGGNLFGASLIKGQSVLAGLQLQFPFLNLGLLIR